MVAQMGYLLQAAYFSYDRVRFTWVSSHCFWGHQLKILGPCDRYKRIYYLDADAIMLRNTDSIFECGEDLEVGCNDLKS